MCVFGLQLRPLPSPVLEGQHDLRQLSTRFGRLIGRAPAVWLGADLDHPDALELPQPLREQAA